MVSSRFDLVKGRFPVLFRIVVIMAAAVMLFLFSSCTDYERAGVNPRPFNEPTDWEQNPYGNAFHN